MLSLDQLDRGTRPEIGAADANDYEYVGIGTDALGGAADAAELLGLLEGRKIQPAEEVVARAGALGEGLVCGKNLLLRCQHIRQSKVAPNVGYINFNHGVYLLCDSLPLCYCKFAQNSTFFCLGNGKIPRDAL